MRARLCHRPLVVKECLPPRPATCSVVYNGEVTRNSEQSSKLAAAPSGARWGRIQGECSSLPLSTRGGEVLAAATSHLQRGVQR